MGCGADLTVIVAPWSEAEVANLLLAIVTINGWNRLAISTRLQPSVAPVAPGAPAGAAAHAAPTAGA